MGAHAGAVADSGLKSDMRIEGPENFSRQRQAGHDTTGIGHNQSLDAPVRVDEKSRRKIGLCGVFAEGVMD